MATLLNDRNELLYTASSRVTGATVSITSGVVTSLVVPKGSTVTVPGSIPLQANVTGYVAPSFTWSYRFGDSGNFTAITGTTNIVSFTCDAAFLTAAGTNTLVQFKVVVAETTGSLGINQSEYTLSLPILREGTNGNAGINSIVVVLYKRTATNVAPTFTTQDLSANSTYTFNTGQVVGQPTGWTQTIPASSSGAYLWVTQVLAASTAGSYAFANTQWSTPVLYTQDGAAGGNGTNTAVIYAYQRSATALTSNPGTVDYSFSTNSITTATLANGWSKTIPSGNDPLYVTLATAASTGSSDSVLAAEWTTPVQMVKDGTNGINNATIYLYARNNNSATAPTLATTGSATYDFTTGAISGTLPSGWTATIPAEANGSVIWVVQATAAANTSTDTIANTEWSTARVLGQQGSNGAPGTRGSRQLYDSSSSYSATYVYLTNAAGAVSYAAKATALIATATSGSTPTTPIKGDTVTFSNNTSGSEYVYTITHDGTNWVTPGTVIDGSLLVTGTVTAAKINSNGLSIKDTAGNVILSAGNSLAASSLNLPGTVSNVPAGWQNSNVNIGGRNLLLGTASGVGWTYSSRSGTEFAFTGASTGEAGYIYSPYFNMWGNQEITLSFESKEDAIITSRDLFILPDNYAAIGLLSTTFAKSADWVRYYFTFTTPAAWGTQSSPATVRLRIDHNGSTGGASASIYARNIKLELGNKPTDWMPAPQDSVYTDLSNAPSSIKNSNISLSSAGALTGAGGGAVTIAGLGTTGSFGGGQIAINTDFLVSTNGLPYGYSIYNNGGFSITSTVSAGGVLGNAKYWRLQANAAINNTFGFYLNNASTLFGGWKANTTYIISFYARSGTLTSNFGDRWNQTPPSTVAVLNPALSTTWQRYVWKINFGTSAIDDNGYWTYQDTIPSGAYIDFSNLQIEIGEAASGWSPVSWVDSAGNIQGVNGGAGTGVANSNISISSGGVLSNAGGGTVTISGLGYTGALDANKTYVDGTGNIQGVSSGAGTGVANSNISISSGGALSGAGGGTVTIGGLGYTGALNANNTYVDASGTIQGVSSGAGTTVDNAQVKVGGTNFFLNSSRFTGLSYWSSNGGTVELDTSVTYGGYNTVKISGNQYGAQHGPVMRLKADTLYTVSALVKGSTNALTGAYDSNLHIQSWRDEDTGNVHQETAIGGDYAITTSWKVIYQTFRTPASANATYCRFYFYPLATGFTLNIAYTKLEEGNKPTDWTPNPEEIKNTNVSISSGGALSGAGGGTVTIGGLGYTGALDANKTYVDSTGNIQGVSSGGGTVVNNNYIENGVLHVYRPLGASASATQSGKAGAIKIRLPQGWTATMLKFYVEIYEYNSGGPSSYNIGGYNYTGGGGYWVNTFATYTGTPGNVRPVYFGYDASGYCCVWIGNPAGTWEYPQVRVIDFSAGYSNYEEAKWATGWSVGWDTAAATNVTGTVSSPTPGGTLSGANSITSSNVGSLVNTNAGLTNSQISVSVSSGGALTASGGPTASGTVTISGLGYTGALNATYGADWATNVTGATAVNNAITSAQTTADLKLSKAGADTLTGPISLNAATAILVGDTTNGLYLGNTGIVGRKNGNTKFYIDQNGNAGFSGDISGATGTFSGTVSAGSIDVGKLSGQTQSFVSGSGSVTTVNDYSEVVLTINGAGGGGGGGGGRYIVYQGIYGGGAPGGPGGNGGTYIKTVTGVANGTVINYSIGTGGTGGYSQGGTGAVGQAGTAGGDSSATILGTTYTAYGGGGGTGASGGGVAGTQGSAGAGGGTGSAGGALNGGYGGSGQSSAGTPIGSSGGPGGSGSVIIQMYNPNGVVRRDEWNTLVTHLTQRFGSYSWP